MKWFKCSNTIVLNPKLGFVAKISKSYKHEVIAAWLYLLSEASKNQEKGNLGNLDFDSMDFALEFLPNKSRKIYESLVGKGMIENNAIVGWVEYQCDPTAAERQRKSRALKSEVSQPVTVCHSDITESHAVTVEEKRGEEKRIPIDKSIGKGTRIEVFCKSVFSESELLAFEKNPHMAIPTIFEDIWKTKRGEWGEIAWKEWEKFYTYFTSKDAKRPTRKDWPATWMNWITR